MCLLFHKWDTWEQYDVDMIRMLVGRVFPEDVRGKEVEIIEHRQKRICLRCGFAQDEEIRGS